MSTVVQIVQRMLAWEGGGFPLEVPYALSPGISAPGAMAGRGTVVGQAASSEWPIDSGLSDRQWRSLGRLGGVTGTGRNPSVAGTRCRGTVRILLSTACVRFATTSSGSL
jgi:hypothetical protein